jgi:hypothetical protein
MAEKKPVKKPVPEGTRAKKAASAAAKKVAKPASKPVAAPRKMPAPSIPAPAVAKKPAVAGPVARICPLVMDGEVEESEFSPKDCLSCGEFDCKFCESQHGSGSLRSRLFAGGDDGDEEGDESGDGDMDLDFGGEEEGGEEEDEAEDVL